jgi:hypothetical protein
VSRYTRDGAALVRCPECDEEQRLEWKAGGPPIIMPRHCNGPMLQVTHNDGETPLSEPCPAHCCAR